MPPDLAGVAFAGMTLKVVDAFLAGEAEETLYWEAKADGRATLNAISVRNAVCGFANSARGGYLFVGARKADRGYVFTGLERPPDGELGTWISDVLGDGGVLPLPHFEVRVFPDRAGVAIVAIDPVHVPPCVTSSGGLFIRTHGKTPSVNDPSEVARLYRAGKVRLLADGVAALDGVIGDGTELCTRLEATPPDPDDEEAAHELVVAWIRAAVQVQRTVAPGMMLGLMYFDPPSVRYGGPPWRGRLLIPMRERLRNLVELQRAIFAASL